MAKFRFTKNKTRKAAIAALCAVAVTCTSLAAACQPNNDDTDINDPVRASDDSTLTNGSFEFFSVPDDAVYLIKNVQDWSRSGDSSGTMSGIISTAEKDWKAITASDLADTLDKNNDLLTSDDKYVDYNGMKSNDIPYKDTYAANLDESAVKDDSIINKNDLTYAKFLGIREENGKYYYGEGENEVEVYYAEGTGDFYFNYDKSTEEYSNPVRLDTIKNPETYHGSYNEKDGKYYLGEGKYRKEIFVDEDGNYYKDEDHEYSEGNVLMIHNYPTDTKYNGIQQYYSSTTVTLEARTAAKISVWVKTSDLKFDKGYSLFDEQDRGAFIEVVQTVGGTTIDEFTIKAINTEKILADNEIAEDVADYTSNGWLQYNIYVNACDFAASTIQLRLGLGKPNGETCTGYAFFDDVTIEKELYIKDLDGYTDVNDEFAANETYCNLASEGDDKIFYADREVRGGSSDKRNSNHFNYLIDLASSSGTEGYQTVILSGENVTAGLTTEKDGKKNYATAVTYEGKTAGSLDEIAETNYDLYDKMTARPTGDDLLGLFTSSDKFSTTGIQEKYYKALDDALLGEKTSFANLPTGNDGTMLAMFSAWGNAYTSTITSDTFTLGAGKQMIVSFWVKTSDMDGHTAATIYLYDTTDTDRENAQTINIDTTGITTDIGDEEDIYNGWVQCFFFVQNNTKDEDAKNFQIDFCFGNTSITSATSYVGGWVALANMQTLEISEEVYNITSTASYTQKFQFSTEDKEKTNHKFADALGTYDITDEIALPSGYNGVNGGSSPVSDADYHQNFDVWNTNHYAGLINRDNFFDDDGNDVDWNGLLNAYFKSATSSVVNWDNVFGKDCYQPLIIVNNLRRYADNAHLSKEAYDNRGDIKYYVRVDEEDITQDGKYIQDNAGRYYTEATGEFDEDETYYTFQEVVNYGFIGENKTISSSATEIISVKVLVTGGATAYVYLVDADTREIMSYSAPGYTFFYDNEGNVLDEEFDKDWSHSERDEHTIYDKQDNGLYKDKDGNYVANLYNLKKIYYKVDGAHYWYDTKDGREEYKGKKLEEGVDYYADKTSDTPSPHRLCNSNDTPIYEYKDGEYYYIVDGKVTDTKVGYFDTSLAKLRYDYTGDALDDTLYAVKVEDTHGEWVTVNFVVKAGNQSKSYRLELWSGERDKTGADQDLTTGDGEGETPENYAKGAVAFDYSAYSITSSNYESILRTDTDSYEKTIIAKYQKLLAAYENEFPLDEDATIKAYEKLAKDHLDEINTGDLEDLQKSYTAHYYTYSLYDSEEFIPYNKEVAVEGDTDYDYTAPDSESLAFFRNEVKDKDDKTTTYNVFIDYSAVEQEVSRTTAPSDSDTDKDDDSDAKAGDFWLQLASILLVVVLLFVLLALIARIIIKEIRRKLALKKQSKNVYRKRDRYLRKLHIEAEETEEIENPNLQNDEAEEAPAEEVTEEAPVEEAPAEEVTEAPVEETPAETTEAPAEEKPEETPSESSEDKPE